MSKYQEIFSKIILNKKKIVEFFSIFIDFTITSRYNFNVFNP